MMRDWPTSLSVVLLSLSLGACGQGRSRPSAAGGAGQAVVASRAAGSSNEALHRQLKGDEDDDDSRANQTAQAADGDADYDNDAIENAKTGYHDGDDRMMTTFGHRASAQDGRQILALVQRYYAAADAGDAQTACALTYSLRAESLPEDYGPAYLPTATTCAQILAVVFKRFRSQLTAPIDVTEVRVQGNVGHVLLGSAAMPASVTEVRREHGAWKLDRVLSAPLR